MDFTRDQTPRRQPQNNILFDSFHDTLPTLSQYTRFPTSSPKPSSEKIHIPVPIPSLNKDITVPIFSGYAHENSERFMSEFTSYMTYQGLDIPEHENRLIAAFHLHLAGPARVWFSTLQTKVTGSLTWQKLFMAFKSEYINNNYYNNPNLLVQSEIFNNMRLGPTQPLEEFYSILVEKANKLQKSDLDILTKFIDGLPSDIKYFVRVQNPKTHAEALISAQMGQAYGYRTNPGLNSKDRLVLSDMPKAEPCVQSAQTERMEIAEMKEQISRLTNTIDKLQNSGHSMTVSSHQHQDFSNKRIPSACFKCCAHGHYAKQCRWDGVSPVQTDTKCQLCDMFGHTAIHCVPVPLNLRGQAGRGRGRLGPQHPQNVPDRSPRV